MSQASQDLAQHIHRDVQIHREPLARDDNAFWDWQEAVKKMKPLSEFSQTYFNNAKRSLGAHADVSAFQDAVRTAEHALPDPKTLRVGDRIRIPRVPDPICVSVRTRLQLTQDGRMDGQSRCLLAGPARGRRVTSCQETTGERRERGRTWQNHPHSIDLPGRGDFEKGRVHPAHGAHGPDHFALGVPTDSLDQWRDHLRCTAS